MARRALGFKRGFAYAASSLGLPCLALPCGSPRPPVRADNATCPARNISRRRNIYGIRAALAAISICRVPAFLFFQITHALVTSAAPHGASLRSIQTSATPRRIIYRDYQQFINLLFSKCDKFKSEYRILSINIIEYCRIL